MATQFDDDAGTPVAVITYQGDANGRELWIFAPLSHYSPNDPGEDSILTGSDGTTATLPELVAFADREKLAIKFLPRIMPGSALWPKSRDEAEEAEAARIQSDIDAIECDEIESQFVDDCAPRGDDLGRRKCGLD